MYSDLGNVGYKMLVLEIILKESKIRHKKLTMFEGHDELHDMKVIYSHFLPKEKCVNLIMVSRY
jgi:hypothetical protein